MMIRSPVASTNIVSVGYDEASETLEIEFKSGAVYQYYNVPQVIYEGLRGAPSAGQFFAYEIRDRYAYSRTG